MKDMDGFRYGKYQSQVYLCEKYCYWASLIIGVLTSMAYFSFHPISGNPPDALAYYFINNLPMFLIICMQCTSFIGMITLIYVQLFPLAVSCYIGWSVLIYSYRLKEYIETNLCKEYDSFDYIDSPLEQNSVFYHFKRSTHYHQLLKW